MPLDEDLFRALNAPGTPVLDPVMVAFGVVGFLAFALLWSIPLWFGGRRREAVDLALLLALDSILVFFLKGIVARERPTIGVRLEVPLDDVMDFAFPSGHTTRAFAASLLLTMRTRDWRWGIPLFVYAGIMAVSRVYVGVHWPTDVLAGALLGLAWAFAFERFTRSGRYAAFRDRLVVQLASVRRGRA